MVGMLWQNLAQYQTWFGPAPYLVHGIQILPVTDVTESVLDHALAASGEWDVFSASCAATPACEADGWAAFVAMERALIDPVAAWRDVCALDAAAFSSASPAGNGNSRLNAFYWIATRPGATDAAVGATGCRGSYSAPAPAVGTLLALRRSIRLGQFSQHLLIGSQLTGSGVFLLVLGVVMHTRRRQRMRWHLRQRDVVAAVRPACQPTFFTGGHELEHEKSVAPEDSAHDYRRLGSGI